MPRSQPSGSSRRRRGWSPPRTARRPGRSSTRNAQPWLNPALGARTAFDSSRSTTVRLDRAVGVGRRTIRRLRTTSWNSMEAIMPADFEAMWPTSRRSGGRRRAAATSDSRSLGPERESVAWFAGAVPRPRPRVERDGNGNTGRVVAAAEGASGPAVLTGSHLDSVLDGGAYDGPLGVVRRWPPSTCCASAASCRPAGRRRRCSSRRRAPASASPASGSRLADRRSRTGQPREPADRDGVACRREALAGLTRGAAVDLLRDVGCFVELHVEQGRDLVDRDAAVGAASGIWPHGRYRFAFTGEANHDARSCR